jgi:hypothetical protein
LENAAILLAGWFNLLRRFLQSTCVELEAPVPSPSAPGRSERPQV